MMRENQGNIFRVIHETGCNLSIAKEALKNSNNWSDTFKYAREKVQTVN